MTIDLKTWSYSLLRTRNGQRVSDLLKWSDEIEKLYRPQRRLEDLPLG